MTGNRAGRLKAALGQIDELIRTGRLAEAEALARRTVAENPLSAQAQFAFGYIAQSSGRFEVAEPAFARAVTLDPRNANYLTYSGLCLLSMGRVPEAAARYRKALEVDPRGTDTLWRHGSFLQRIGHMEEALSAFGTALGRAPEATRHAIRHDMVECLLSLGRVEEAEEQMQRDLARTPFRNRYLCLLSGTRKHDAGSELFALIEQAIAEPGLPLMERSDLIVRKGVLLHNSGRHADAFETIREGKRLLRAPSPVPAFTREVDQRIALFTPERLADLQARYGRSDDSPIFVVGLPRSGTTLAAQIISAHSKVGNAGELETMTYAAAKLGGMRPLADFEAAIAQLGVKGVGEIAALYERVLRFVVPGKQQAVDKMPQNFRVIAEASILFPRARFVHCTRHPADTFISAFQSEMNAAHAYSHDPADYAAYFRQYRRLMAHWQRALPGRIFTLSYEKLVSAPEAEIMALLAYLGLDLEEGCLHPERNAGAVTTFSRLQVRAGINTASVQRWKPYERFLTPLLEAAQDTEAG
jgi:tetratricopeptide (TPR) repeat protein